MTIEAETANHQYYWIFIKYLLHRLSTLPHINFNNSDSMFVKDNNFYRTLFLTLNM